MPKPDTESNLKFVDEHEHELFASAMLGEQVRQFLLTDPVGVYLHGRAKAEIDKAKLDILDVDPDGWRGWFQAKRKLRAIRKRVAVAEALIDFLAEAIQDGQNSERELNEYRT